MTASAKSIDASPIAVRSGETVLVTLDLTNWALGSGVTISSASVSDADSLTITSVTVNAAAVRNRDTGSLIAIGKGITMLVAGASAGTQYDVIMTASTSNGQTLKPKVTFIGV